MENKVKDNREEQRIEREANEKFHLLMKHLRETPGNSQVDAIESAMQEYFVLKAKPLVEALELAYNYLQSGISVNPHSGIHNTIEKALQDYNKK